jgi:Xaa-Pro aminopeptidase
MFSQNGRSAVRRRILPGLAALLLVAGAVAQTESPFTNDIYQQRREALLDSIDGGTAILYSSGYQTDAGYRADGNFWYLTGLDDPGAILVLAPKERDRQILLLAPRNPEAERWTGVRPALSESLKVALGYDKLRRTNSLDYIIVDNMQDDPVLHLISGPAGPNEDIPPDLDLYDRVSSRIPGVSIQNSSRFLRQMRAVKSDLEIAALERAIQITHNGLTDMLAAMQPDVAEFQLDGILEESFKRQGAMYQSFPPILGSGVRSTILHYERRNRTLREGQLLLADVGAEWAHYCADVTRTFPVDGQFSAEQAEIYDIVLKANEAAIQAVRPGLTLSDIDDVAREVIREAGYADDFIHGTSHYLGLDVHDYGDDDAPLAAGMVITVEPGIYLPEKEIGVRIEDDVLVTAEGFRVLTADIPKERADVEAWIEMAKQKKEEDL